MTYKLGVSQQATYLHVVITGKNTKQNAIRCWDEILRECEARGCFRVLAEGRLEGTRLPLRDLFQIVLNVSTKAKGKFKAIAYVDINAVSNSLQFAETAAVNRGLPVAVFSTVAEAGQWLVDTS